MRLLRIVEAFFVALREVLATLVRRARRGPRRPTWTLRIELAQSVPRALLMRSKQRGIRWLRDALAGLPTVAPYVNNVTFERVTLGGVPCEWCSPRERETFRTIVYFHGGGYVFGSLAGLRDLLSRFALAGDARVLGVEYRLAPEHPFPAQQDDCLTATRALLATGTEPKRVALAGDSAGGALAVATLCALRDAGDPLPAAAALICPWTEPYAEGGSMDTNAPFDFGDRELLVGWARAAIAGGDASDPRFTVANAKLEGLPPLLIQVGGVEILYDQVLRFAQRARAAGVMTSLERLPEMFHDVHLQASFLREGAAALDTAARFLYDRTR